MDDVLNDALSNLEHDNYERSHKGYENRQSDVALIRAALAGQPADPSHPKQARAADQAVYDSMAQAYRAGQPAASAEPEQYKTDDELGGVLAAIRHYGGQKWMEGRGVADDDLKNVRKAWDAVYERVQALARYGKAGDAFWSRNGLRATLATQPAASAEPSDEDAAKFADQHGMYYDQDASIAGAHARALLSRYGRPAGDAQPVRWVHTLHSEHDDPIAEKVTGTPKNPFGKPRIDYDPAYRVTSEPLYAAPVAAQKADDSRDAERYRWLRERDLDVIVDGGVFAGKVPDNVVLNGIDLDSAIDAAMAGSGAHHD